MKCIKELELDLMDIKAYRQLQSDNFDFGNGIIINDSPVSEDVYFKMEQLDLENALYCDSYIDDLEYIIDLYYKHKKIRLNRHARKAITQKKLKSHYSHYHGMCYWHDEKNIFVRDTGRKIRKRCIKKQARKKTRRRKNDFPLKGNGFRKIFDYWWELC